ncbi:MAG: hypothetical protein MUP67_13100, partial [Acidimicrobiia bacterium]|nr:hypothetical protein [Acidimicrobiia bacterium]
MGEQLSRRAVIARGAGGAVAVALGSAAFAGGAGALERGAGDTVGGGGTVVVVPEYPFFAGTTMQEDP